MMNDLLGNLAAKALNVAPLVEPRPLSRFEPWQTGNTLEATPLDQATDRQSFSSMVEVDQPAPPMPRATSATAAARPSHADAEAQPDRRSASTQAADQKPPLIERIERVLIERPAIDHAEPDRSRRAFQTQPATNSRLIDDAPAQPQPTPTMMLAPSIVPPAPPIETGGQRLNNRVENEDVVAQTHQRPSITLPVVETRPSQYIDIEQPSTDRAVMSPSNNAQTIDAAAQHAVANVDRSVRPHPVPTIERAPAPAQPQSAVAVTPPATPMIHVSIGRVEVRATLSTMPAKRSAATTSNTSLDDYLKWRSGDRR